MELYVSVGKGNDKYNGLKDTPFRSLERAKSEVSKIVSEGNVKDITVWVDEGTYYLENSLSFGYDDVRDVNISFRGMEGCLPKVVAGKPIEDWEPYTDKIYKTKLDRSINMLFEDFKLCRKSRFPKQGYFRVSFMDKDSKRVFYTNEAADIQLDEDSQVSIWPGGKGGEWNWFNIIVNVEKKEHDKITLGANACYDLGVGTRFFLQNSLSMLTEPGEFYYDEKNRELYYYPIHKLGESVIVAPTAHRVISAVGEEDAFVENLLFENFEFCCTDTHKEFIRVRSEEEINHDGLVYLENCRNVTIKDCKIHDTGIHGVLINGRNQENKIIGNELYDIGHSGVQIQGPIVCCDNINVRNLVSNNHMHDLGHVVRHSAGVQILQSGYNTVEHNHIHHSRRYCISLKATPYATVKRYYQGQDVENLESYKLTRGNLLYANEVHHANLETQDTGVIEAYNCLENTISKNIVRDSNIPFSFGFGIYLDDQNIDTVVDNNIIYNLQKEGSGEVACVIQVKGQSNTVCNNIIADNTRLCCSDIGMMALGDDINDNIVSTRNIFYRSSPVLYSFNGIWVDDKVKTSENNIVYQDGDEVFIDGMLGKSTRKNFSEWQEIFNNQYDQFSAFVDPEFVGENDYRMKYTSYARALGIQDIDISDIGLTKDFQFPYAEDTQGKIYVNGSMTYLALKSDECCDLHINYRTGNRFLRTLSVKDLQAEIADPEIAELCEEGIKGKKKGVTQLRLTYDGVTDIIDILVDDTLKELTILVPKNTMAVGDKLKYKVIGRTEFGRYISDIPDVAVSCSEGIHLDDEFIYGDAVGEGQIEITRPLSAKCMIHVVDDIFSTLVCDIVNPIVRVGEEESVEVQCITRKGNTIDYDSLYIASSDPNVFVVENDKIKAVGAGVSNITVVVKAGGVEKKKVLPVCGYAGEDIPGYDLYNYKNSKGVCFRDEKDDIHIITRSSNIWFREDEATFLAKTFSPDKKVTVMVDIIDIHPSHHSSQVGLLIRSDNTANSKMVNLRILKGGGVNMRPPEIMMCSRRNDNDHPNVGGGGVGALPVTLRLEYHDNKVTGSYKIDKDWVTVAEEEFVCSKDILCGLTMFSVNTEQEASAVVRNLTVYCE